MKVLSNQFTLLVQSRYLVFRLFIRRFHCNGMCNSSYLFFSITLVYFIYNWACLHLCPMAWYTVLNGYNIHIKSIVEPTVCVPCVKGKFSCEGYNSHVKFKQARVNVLMHKCNWNTCLICVSTVSSLLGCCVLLYNKHGEWASHAIYCWLLAYLNIHYMFA